MSTAPVVIRPAAPIKVPTATRRDDLYATAAQGAKADTALQPAGLATGEITPRDGDLDLNDLGGASTIEGVDGLQTALDAKLPADKLTTGNRLIRPYQPTMTYSPAMPFPSQANLRTWVREPGVGHVSGKLRLGCNQVLSGKFAGRDGLLVPDLAEFPNLRNAPDSTRPGDPILPAFQTVGGCPKMSGGIMWGNTATLSPEAFIEAAWNDIYLVLKTPLNLATAGPGGTPATSNQQLTLEFEDPGFPRAAPSGLMLMGGPWSSTNAGLFLDGDVVAGQTVVPVRLNFGSSQNLTAGMVFREAFGHQFRQGSPNTMVDHLNVMCCPEWDWGNMEVMRGGVLTSVAPSSGWTGRRWINAITGARSIWNGSGWDPDPDPLPEIPYILDGVHLRSIGQKYQGLRVSGFPGWGVVLGTNRAEFMLNGTFGPNDHGVSEVSEIQVKDCNGGLYIQANDCTWGDVYVRDARDVGIFAPSAIQNIHGHISPNGAQVGMLVQGRMQGGATIYGDFSAVGLVLSTGPASNSGGWIYHHRSATHDKAGMIVNASDITPVKVHIPSFEGQLLEDNDGVDPAREWGWWHTEFGLSVIRCGYALTLMGGAASGFNTHLSITCQAPSATRRGGGLQSGHAVAEQLTRCFLRGACSASGVGEAIRFTGRHVNNDYNLHVAGTIRFENHDGVWAHNRIRLLGPSGTRIRGPGDADWGTFLSPNLSLINAHGLNSNGSTLECLIV